MAITKIWAVKSRIDLAIDYTTNEEKTLNPDYDKNEDDETEIRSEYEKYYEEETPNIYNDFDVSFDYATNPDKTENQFFVTGVNCIADIAKEEMLITKKQFNKTGGILALHLVQSFKEGEVTPEIAHEIGVRLAEEIWGDRFEVVVSTHLNTKHYHNHFIANSVSFVDGKKNYMNNTLYALIRQVSDELCREYGLSVIEEKKTKVWKIDYTKFQKKYTNTPYYKETKADIDKAIRQAISCEDFEELLGKMGYTLTYRADKLSTCRDGYKRNIRVERAFGKDYTIENIGKRILEETETRIPFPEAYKRKRFYSKYPIKKYKIDKKYRTSLYRLYLYYRYKLNQYRSDDNYERLSPETRKAIRKMDEYSEEAKFLSSRKIQTNDDLMLYHDSLSMELEMLENDYAKARRGYETTINRVEILNKMKFVRQEVAMCKRIEERLPKIKEELKANDKNLEEREERVQDERIR